MKTEIGKCDHRKSIGAYFLSRADWFGIEIHGITPYVVYGQRGIGKESMFWYSDKNCIWSMETWTQPAICTRVYSSLDKGEPAYIVLQHWNEWAEDEKPRYWYTVILLSLKSGITILEDEEASVWVKKNHPGLNGIPRE